MKRWSRVFSGSPKPIPPKEAEEPKETNIAPLSSTCMLEDRSIDDARPLRVVVIGAGISGILACIRFVQRIPNLELCIYEKNADIGGTWFENRYPGCACGGCPSLTLCLEDLVLTQFQRKDIPAHTYQATFEPNKEWSTFYASAPEIHRYWKRVADKYGCMKYIKLKQQVSEAAWDEQDSKWRLQVRGQQPRREEY